MQDERKINFRILFFGFISLFIGISFARKFFVGDWLAICVAVILLAGVIFFCVFRQQKFLWKRFVLLVLTFLFGVGYFFVGQAVYLSNDYSNQTGVIVGRVEYVSANQVVLANATFDDKQINNIILSTNIVLNAQCGDLLTFEGELEHISFFNSEKFSSFYYRNHVAYKVVANKDDIVSVSKGMNISENFKFAIKQKLKTTMTGESADIAYAIIFGETDDLKYATLSAYEETGILHLIAVSGLNVTFLASILFFILKAMKINGKFSYIILAIILFIYTALCSFAPSIVRASLMFLVLFFGQLIGKRYDPLSCIGFSGILILLFRPLFAFDLGFILSYLCVIAIFVCYKPIYRFLRKRHLPKWLSGSLAISLATQFGILPVYLSYFSQVPLLGVFVNVLAVPLFEVAYISSLILLPFTFIWQGFAIFLQFPAFIYYAITSLAYFVAGLSFASVSAFKSNVAVNYAYYFCVYNGSRFVNNKKSLKNFQNAIAFSLAFILTFISMFV